MLQIRLVAPLFVVLLGSSTAFATDGYFSHGFGIKSVGIGGVGIALPQDGLAAATNPAGTAFVADRADVGLTWFSPKRRVQIVGNNLGPGGSADGTYEGNGQSNFFIPEIGYIKKIDPATTTGVAVYGNGGMNTQYANNPFAKFSSPGNVSGGTAGINLAQLFISPSLAYKPNEQNALGVAVNFAYQQFSAQGLGAFGGSSASKGNLTDRGTDSATGWGIRLGWTGHATPDLTLGATWASKVKTSKFSHYSGLFADSGSFDIPENYGIGLAYKFVPLWTFAADVSQIKYGSISSVANPLSNLFQGNPLGSSNGPGFGWKDVTVVKLGVSYDYTPDLTLRAGFNHSGQAIPSDQTFFNILAPAVVQDHLTLGGTWKTSRNGELSLAYTHAFTKTLNGSIPAGFGGGNANLTMYQNSIGIAYGWKY